jgi:hypothetical protein
MEPLEAHSSSDHVQTTIPRWVYNRIAVLLTATHGGGKAEYQNVAVLEGHARKLNLWTTASTLPYKPRRGLHVSIRHSRQVNQLSICPYLNSGQLLAWMHDRTDN